MSLSRDLTAFIQTGIGDFDSLALRLFVYQYENNLPYQRFCNGRGQTPATVTRWQEIPAAPAAAFKRFSPHVRPGE